MKEQLKILDKNIPEIYNKILPIIEKNENGAYVEYHECSYFVKKELCESCGFIKTSFLND